MNRMTGKSSNKLLSGYRKFNLKAVGMQTNRSCGNKTLYLNAELSENN